jgi:hypothetical protein
MISFMAFVDGTPHTVPREPAKNPLKKLRHDIPEATADFDDPKPHRKRR